MKECRVVVPKEAFSDELHYLMQLALARQFEGYVQTEGVAGVMDRVLAIVREPVLVYDFALEDSSFKSLVDFAAWVRVRGKLPAVYVRDGDGRVVHITRYVHVENIPWLLNLDTIIEAMGDLS